jgi:hypothetical protein
MTQRRDNSTPSTSPTPAAIPSACHGFSLTYCSVALIASSPSSVAEDLRFLQPYARALERRRGAPARFLGPSRRSARQWP